MLSRLRRKVSGPWLVLPLAVVVGGGTWFVTRSDGDASADEAPTEQVVEVTRGSMSQTVSAEGTVAAADTEDLSFTAAGTVTAVEVEAGDTVAAGDVLATIDSSELEADVATAEAQVAEAEAQLADDQDAGASDTQIAADESSLAAAQEQLTSAQEALEGASLVATIDGTVSAVDLTVGEELGSSGTSGTDQTGSDTGTGDSSGSLGDDSSSEGSTEDSDSSSSSSSPHIQIVSTGSYEVELGVDATQVDLLEAGQEASITTSTSSSTTGAFPGGGNFPGGGVVPGGAQQSGDEDEAATDESESETADSDRGATAAGPGGAQDTGAEGEVSDVGAVADASSGVATYPVTVAFETDDEDFVVGTNVTVEITYEEVEDVLQVSAQAVTTAEDGTSTVEVRTDDGDTETREVEVGTTSGGMVEITSGLEEGEQVVITFTPPGGGDDSNDEVGGGGQQMPGGAQLPEGVDPSELPAGVFPGGGG